MRSCVLVCVGVNKIIMKVRVGTQKLFAILLSPFTPIVAAYTLVCYLLFMGVNV